MNVIEQMQNAKMSKWMNGEWINLLHELIMKEWKIVWMIA